MITVKNLSYSVSGTEILSGITCVFPQGEVSALLGPNGSGKTTLLRHLCRELPSVETVVLDDRPLELYTARELARSMAVMSQDGLAISADFPVQDLIVMGRYAYKGFGHSYDDEDRRFAATALKKVGLEGFEERLFRSLSGGEKQRVLLARALCQASPVLLLDEPTNHLDIKHRLHLMSLVRGHGRTRTVVVVLHDVNLAAAFCDRLYFLKFGVLVAQGRPDEVVTPDVMETVFEVPSSVAMNGGVPFVRFG